MPGSSYVNPGVVGQYTAGYGGVGNPLVVSVPTQFQLDDRIRFKNPSTSAVIYDNTIGFLILAVGATTVTIDPVLPGNVAFGSIIETFSYGVAAGYCDLEDLKNAKWERVLQQLTAAAATPTVIDTAVVSAAITDADGEIDSHLCLRHTVPLTTVPPVIKRLSMDITIYNLYTRDNQDAPNGVRTKYEDAVKLLMRMADGKAGLGETTLDPTPAIPSHFGHTAPYHHNVFSMKSTGGRSNFHDDECE